jgi:DNA repair photolyase
MAAKEVHEIGYDTRIRVDPIFPINSWETQYEEVLNDLLSRFEPTRIILGTPRGLWKTIHYAKEAQLDMSWTRFFGEDSSWGKKLEFSQRKRIYEFFYDKLASMGYPSAKISMCKETATMWKDMNLVYKPLTCNCYGSDAF